jgi:hypothetical protein
MVKKASGLAEPARADASLGLELWAPTTVAPVYPIPYYMWDAKSGVRVEELSD